MEMTDDRNQKAVDGEADEDEAHFIEENPNDTRCGVFSWRPQSLQGFVRPIYFTLVYLLYGIFQGAMKTGLNSSMTTIERKFGMSGKMISVVMIMDNITGTVASLVVGYYATKISRPRILVFGTWMSISACFFFVLPHIMYGHVGVNTNISRGSKYSAPVSHFTEFCVSTVATGANVSTLAAQASNILPSVEGNSVAIPVLILFSIGNMLNGIGGTAFYIAGLTYTDDNVKKKNSPIYFGTILSLRMVGPLLGVIVNSYFLTINEHPFRPSTGLNTRDPRWIGAWWLPFAGWGVLMMLVSVPLVLFPRYIRRGNSQTQNNSKADKKNAPKSLWQKIVADFKDFVEALKRLSRNPVYVWETLGYIFILNGLGGHMMNLPKYIETQYRVSAAKASFLTGSTKVLAMILGTVLGGVILRIFKPSARTICIYSVLADILNISVLVASIFLPCDNWRLGQTSITSDGSLALNTPCNDVCGCSSKFQPFCDRAFNVSYFSPCYGGCFGQNLTNMDCQCSGTSISGDLSEESTLFTAMRYVGGFCRNDCSNMMTFILITTITKFIVTLPRVGTMLVSLRCIDPADKAMAFGVTSFFLNICAFIPYPLIYGTLFDSTCRLWGSRGNCWYYDNDILRLRFFGLTSTFYAIGTICMTFMAYYASSIGDMFTEQPVKTSEEKDIQAHQDEKEAMLLT